MANAILDPEAGWQHHPEVNRWRGHLPALAAYHDACVHEAFRRDWPSGCEHKTPLEFSGPVVYPRPWEPFLLMRWKLAAKLVQRGR